MNIADRQTDEQTEREDTPPIKPNATSEARPPFHVMLAVPSSNYLIISY